MNRSCLEYQFNNPVLRIQALTHKSYHHENEYQSVGHNERMEFLGDAVLGLVLSEALSQRFPEVNEGILSKMRASLVNEQVLAELALEMGLDRSIQLGKGERNSQGGQKPRILACSLEALIGAIFLDSSFEQARNVIVALFDRKLNTMVPDEAFGDDAKTRLQELVQERLKTVPVYEVVSSVGPAHEREFTVQLAIGGGIVAHGKGRSKKQAEQSAAAVALAKLK